MKMADSCKYCDAYLGKAGVCDECKTQRVRFIEAVAKGWNYQPNTDQYELTDWEGNAELIVQQADAILKEMNKGELNGK